MRIQTLTALTIAGLATAAQASVAITTFAFSDLDTEYFTTDGVSGFFTARAGNDSSGDVTRVQDPAAQTAEYGAAFATDDTSMADVVFEMNISNITSSTAEGLGSFVITDVDGDTISGTLAGMWSRTTSGLPVLFFNGTLTDVIFTASGDGVYEGTDGIGFDLTPFLTDNSFEGGVVQVSFGEASFFDTSFAGFNSQFSGNIVPTPGTAALVMGAGVACFRRRR